VGRFFFASLLHVFSSFSHVFRGLTMQVWDALKQATARRCSPRDWC